ncbi:MAG: hypothetical protein ACR2GA_01580 [Chloroflexota bacterium]
MTADYDSMAPDNGILYHNLRVVVDATIGAVQCGYIVNAASS